MKTQAESKGLAYAWLTALLWGVLAIALKFSVGSLSPVTVVWFRFSFSFIVLLIWMLIFDRKDISLLRRPPIVVLIAALFLGLNYLGFITGVKYTSPSNAQVFIQFGTLGFALAGIFIYKEKVGWKHILGFSMVISGIALFYYEQLASLKGLNGEYTKGILLISGGGIAWAVFASIQKGLVTKLGTNQLNLVIYAFCSLLFLPFINFHQLLQQNLIEWTVLIFLGLNTVLAYGFLAIAIKYATATKVSVIITLNPIMTFAGMAFLGAMEVSWIEPEHFNLLSIIGAGIVLAGVIITILSRKK
ncbi:MAG: DMT family transporter [Bacteroidales bacterium]|nr:DMT family transporter [Bacteroidales bacterium]MCB8999872.1 DMT family transporter [Bacteroidales bacterium]